MYPSQVSRAIEAASSIAAGLGLHVDDVVVVQNSNKLSLRLLPCDTFARVAPASHDHGALEVDLAQRLSESGCPVAALEPRVPPQPYRHDGFEVTFWTFYETEDSTLSPSAHAGALQDLHAGMRSVDVSIDRFTDRVDEALRVVSDPEGSPTLAVDDRALLVAALDEASNAIGERSAPEQLLHGEPHVGNVLNTAVGPRFIDLETCRRGPVEFDLAHVPAVVSDFYPGIDAGLLSDCRRLVLAMVAAWRFEPDDQFPMGAAFGHALVDRLRERPPWPTIDEVYRSVVAPS